MASLAQKARAAVNTRETTKPGLGAIPTSFTPDQRKWLQALSETVQVSEGVRGNYLDKSVTIRDLLDPDLVQFLSDQDSKLTNPGYTTGGDTIPPGKPRNFTITPEAFSVRLSWTNPSDDDLAGIEVWRITVASGSATPNILTDRGPNPYGIATAPAETFTDPAVSDSLVDYYYWIRARDYAGNVSGWVPETGSETPVNPDAPDAQIDKIMDLLENEIVDSYLFQWLQEPVLDRLDDNDTSIAKIITFLNDGVDGTGEIDGAGILMYAQWQGWLTDTVSGFAAVEQYMWAGIGGSGGSGAPADDSLMAQWGIKVQVTTDDPPVNYIAGVGLSIHDKGEDGIESNFIIQADTFAVIQPSEVPGGAPVIPFIVSTIDGDSVVGINGRLVVDHTIMTRSLITTSLSAIAVNAGDITAGFIHDTYNKTSRYDNSVYFDLDALSGNVCLEIGNWYNISGTYVAPVKSYIDMTFVSNLNHRDTIYFGNYSPDGYDRFEFLTSNTATPTSGFYPVYIEGMDKYQAMAAFLPVFNQYNKYYFWADVIGTDKVRLEARAAGTAYDGLYLSCPEPRVIRSALYTSGGVDQVHPTASSFRGLSLKKSGSLFIGDTSGHNITVYPSLDEDACMKVNGDVIVAGNIKANNMTTHGYAEAASSQTLNAAVDVFGTSLNTSTGVYEADLSDTVTKYVVIHYSAIVYYNQQDGLDVDAQYRLYRAKEGDSSWTVFSDPINFNVTGTETGATYTRYTTHANTFIHEITPADGDGTYYYQIVPIKMPAGTHNLVVNCYIR